MLCLLKCYKLDYFTRKSLHETDCFSDETFKQKKKSWFFKLRDINRKKCSRRTPSVSSSQKRAVLYKISFNCRLLCVEELVLSSGHRAGWLDKQKFCFVEHKMILRVVPLKRLINYNDRIISLLLWEKNTIACELIYFMQSLTTTYFFSYHLMIKGFSIFFTTLLLGFRLWLKP